MLAFLMLPALADVVGPNPTDCPPGSIGTANHNGPYCTPSTCENGCADGQECRTVGLCILEEERNCGGMQDPENPCTYTHVEATAACEGPTDCGGDTTCVMAERCVETAGTCGCDTASGPAAAMVLLGLVPLALRRRRDRV